MLIDTHCHLYDDKFENAKEIIDNLSKFTYLSNKPKVNSIKPFGYSESML